MSRALDFVDWLIVAGFALLAVRLFTAGLHRRYRVFFLYCAFATLHLGVLDSFSQSSDAYQHIWVLTEPVEWLFFVLLVLEIYSLVLQDYRGLATVGRWTLILAVVLAVGASLASLMVPSQLTTQGHLMRYYYVAERAVYLSLALFLLTILAFMVQYPVAPSRNIVIHSFVFSFYFLGNTVLYLMVTTRGKGFLIFVTYALDACALAALGAWLALLKPAGETRKLALRPQWMPGKEEDLVNQLKYLNAALLRAGRR